ncbi:uncharacterized protein LOC111323679 isoform X2 [Stylophora pistillata]|uniref:uncharacterized protein LOC111323679 isoform X2 n=1 Tax=Stylophora pistillata TaxID=50429 RepID=UPI000C05593A|nr:uncharacterized protein LOC111323679 isoform X2 [Stylophora pistillata]
MNGEVVIMPLAVAALWKIFFVSHVFAQEKCRILEFVQPEEDNYLENHVIKSFLVDNKDQCEVRCYAEDSCLSFNLGISETKGKFKCELSDSDHFQHPEHLICREGFSYHPTMKLCGTSPCPPAASCVPDIHGKLRCVCPASWTRTESCERDEDECSSGSHGCSADAYCNDTVGSFTCTCKAGFSGDGKECNNINECETGSAECHVNATCNDIIGSYICKCRDNVVGDGFLCVGFPFHFALNGSDPNISLYIGASYRNVDGRTVLYLNGTQRAYAETPALPIRAISFSIMCWIKALSSPSHPSVHHIYSDWSEPHQFRIYISESREICVNLRDPQRRDMIDYCHREIIPNKWMHVAFTWSRDRKEGILYINGIGNGKKRSSNVHSDLIKNEHKVFDIGLKRDSMDYPTFNGYMRDLLVVNKALSEDEVKHLIDIL